MILSSHFYKWLNSVNKFSTDSARSDMIAKFNFLVLKNVSLQQLFKRFMLSTKTTAFIRNTPTVTRFYSNRTAIKLTKQAAKDLNNDGTGKHTHIMENYCISKECENKKCPTLCDQGYKNEIKGHNTHKPPIGRIARFIDNHDANGDPKPQYFIPTNKKVEITEKEKQQYGKDIKEDMKQTNFVQQHDDKYDK